MEENKYICPKCGAEMIAVYEKPALNLTCPKCGCKIATTKWEDIDLDDTDYKIVLKSLAHPSMDQVKLISNLTGQNFIVSKRLLENGGVLLSTKAIEIREKKKLLNENGVDFSISPEFPY